jgi:hypothetical protein
MCLVETHTTMIYRNKYAGGVIVMIKKEISEYFIENMFILSKRGITLTTTNIYDLKLIKQKISSKNLNITSLQKQTKKINIILLKT